MSNITGMLPINGTRIIFPAQNGFKVLGAYCITMNTPALFIEFDPAADMSVWVCLMLQNTAEVPDGAQYAGTVFLAEQKQSMIAVAGSKGMQQQNGVNIHINHIYVMPCPADQVPPEFKLVKADG